MNKKLIGILPVIGILLMGSGYHQREYTDLIVPQQLAQFKACGSEAVTQHPLDDSLFCQGGVKVKIETGNFSKLVTQIKRTDKGIEVTMTTHNLIFSDDVEKITISK